MRIKDKSHFNQKFKIRLSDSVPPSTHSYLVPFERPRSDRYDMVAIELWCGGWQPDKTPLGISNGTEC